MKKLVLKITLAVALVAGVAGSVSVTQTVDTAAEVQPMLDPGQGTRPPS